MNGPPELPASDFPVVPARRKVRWWIPVVIIASVLVAIPALLVALAMPGLRKARTSGQRGAATAFARQVEQSVTSFYTDNQTMPAPENTTATKGGNLFKTDSPEGLEVVNILAGSAHSKINPAQIKYLTPRKASPEKKNGAVHDPGDSRITGLYDPWGNPYLIILDTTYEERVIVPFKTPVTLNGRRAAVYSAGPDGVLETKDDIKTWR